ncbi:RNA-directed DNA polymerase, eukaryota, reverse transcriptase zinc-binding domain protein [Tanacetum coccineum]
MLVSLVQYHGISGPNAMLVFKDKMKHLKSNIKLWARQFNALKSEEKAQLYSKLTEIERDLEAGLGSSALHSRRKEMLLKLRDIEHVESLDAYQKAKIKWGIEADENTKFFHGIINKNRRGLAIKCIMKDGTWFTDPGEIKDIFREFFVEKFKHFEGVNVTRRSDHYKTLSPAQASLLEHPVSELEVYDAVRECGSEKSPDRDMAFMGFGCRWRGWIRGCLKSAKASVLINGSPSYEFSLHHGLRQVTFISLFYLFGVGRLHVAVEEPWEWSRSNIIGIVSLLHCFHNISGLKINLQKSSLYGIGVNNREISNLASYTGCSPPTTPIYVPGNSSSPIVSLVPYKILAQGFIANRLSRVIDFVISPEQTAFVKGRQILDGPLMVNEIINWYKNRKRSLMIFKVDFEKAFDSVSWDFLDRDMAFMGFGCRWRGWIRGCLKSAKASVLINGSPSYEFSLHHGLRQGDPLSPFLFILVMEALHVAVEDAIDVGLYREWSRSNIIGIVSLLHCFHNVSGLKINLQKSSLYGIGVNNREISNLASNSGCYPPTNYQLYVYLITSVLGFWLLGSSALTIPEQADENSKFFHGIINKNRRGLAIKGIMKDGTWFTDPGEIKDIFQEFFVEKFKHFEGVNVTRRSDHYKTLSPAQASLLEHPVSELEVYDAVRECGSEKSPGPDGFSFAFYKKYWDLLKIDIMAYIREFFETGKLPSVDNPLVVSDFRPISLIGAQYKILAKILANRLSRVIDSVISPEQTAFVKGRQILDGPLMVNEIINWYKNRKQSLMIFKVDFEKAFDSVSWDFLDRVMAFMGFGCRWRGWIRGCLKSAKASVLINGSPSYEFSLHRGLRQGDPLSPFLFILVMEALHVAVEDAIDVGLYRGVQIRSLHISHLFFADDVLFLGEWSRSNIIGIVSLLLCFHNVSGLKINLQKSSLYGIGVNNREISNLASYTGCSPPTTPIYVPGNSSRSTLITSVLGSLGVYYLSLFPMPKQINRRLESLRANFFWGCTDGIKKIPWISWNSVLASKLKGGLGIGSLEALNLSLIQKWRWRFFNSPQALWVKVISEIHGSYGTAGSVFFHQCGGSGTWSRIVGAINGMHDKGIIPHSSIKRQVKDGSATRFWRDAWLDDIPLERKFPRLFCLEANKDCLVRDRWQNGWVWCWTRNFHGGVTASQLDSMISLLVNVTLSEGQDTWQWNLIGSNIFNVKDIRLYIDSISLPEFPTKTRWCRFIPRKINILVWRILRDRIPTRWNLSMKGFEVPSLLCPLCNISPETSSHLFWTCNLANSVWHLIFKWLDLPLPNLDNLNDVFGWLDHAHLKPAFKIIMHSIFGVVVWKIWQSRNNNIFGDKKMLQQDLYDQIVDASFLWYSSRNRICKVSRSNWIQNPLLFPTL